MTGVSCVCTLFHPTSLSLQHLIIIFFFDHLCATSGRLPTGRAPAEIHVITVPVDLSDFSADAAAPRVPSASGGERLIVALRPGVRRFLAELSAHYELHVYTHGNRAYAQVRQHRLPYGQAGRAKSPFGGFAVIVFNAKDRIDICRGTASAR